MNAKAAKIESIIQGVNRNLLLIYADQMDGMQEFEAKSLRKLGGKPFKNDKFAYEMAHFVSSESSQIGNDVLANAWNSNFLKGLELLLYEAALVKDDIERDCFVSRIYVWFNEKLVERRDLPKPALTSRAMSGLRQSVANMGAENTAKALDEYASKLPEVPGAGPPPSSAPSGGAAGAGGLGMGQAGEPSWGPPVLRPASQGTKVPLYVQHAYPGIMQHRDMDFNVGRVRGKRSKENADFGLLHYTPETEAEKTMHTLWLARRRQEAFEWKTQQQLAVAMDRLAVHKSRLESDALRRQESSHLLESRRKSRPGSAASDWAPDSPPQRPPSAPQRPWSASDGGGMRFASRMERPISANTTMRHRPPMTLKEREDEERRLHDEVEAAVAAQVEEEERLARAAAAAAAGEEEEEGNDSEMPGEISAHTASSGLLPVVVSAGGEDPLTVPVQKMSRTLVKKGDAGADETSVKPMRFGISRETKTIGKTFRYKKDQVEHTEYMVNYDSDEDVETGGDSSKGTGAPGLAAGLARKVVTKKATGGGGGGAHAPPRRDRPISAYLFRDVSGTDPELKVHYRQSNFRRMPLTEEQEKWLDAQEKAREKKAAERIAAMKEAAAAKGGKDGKKDGKDKDKDKGGKGKGKDAKGKEAPEPEPVKKVCKYKSASDFMRQHFPNFDPEGPLRTFQLLEVKEIMEALGEDNVKEATLIKALVIPQDRPESMCLERLAAPGEGLMINPLPEEYWRKTLEGGKGKKGKKGGKKKK